MKKNVKVLIFLVLFCLLFSLGVGAETTVEEQYSASGLQEVWEHLDYAVKDRLEQWGVTPDHLFAGEGITIGSVWKTLVELLTDSIKNPLSAGGATVSVILLCGFADVLSPEGSNSMKTVLSYFSVICIGAVLMVPVGYLLSKTASVIGAVGEFMMAFLPVYVGILLTAGRSLTAGGAGSLVFGAAQVISYLSRNVIMPFIGMFFALSFCASSGNLHMNGFPLALKKGAIWILGLATTLFSALLGITGIINGAGDSMAQRTTRFFIGNMVPVIGGALSESLATVQGCFSVLKTAGGIFGIVTVLSFLLPVFVEILLWRGVLMVVTAVAESTETGEIACLLRAVGDGVGILLSLVICSFMIYTVSLSVMAMAGGGGV